MLANQPKFKVVLLGIDLFLLACSFAAAVHVVIPDFWEFTKINFYFGFSHVLIFMTFAWVFIFSFLYNNLYKRNVVVSRHRQFFLVLKAYIFSCAICTLILLALSFRYFSINGKTIIVYFYLWSFLAISLYRVLFIKYIFLFLAKKQLYKTKILIIGGDEAAHKVASALEQDTLSNFEIAGFVDDYKKLGAPIFKDHTNLGKIEDLPSILQQNAVDEILIAIDHLPYPRLIFLVEACLTTQKIVRIYSDFLNVIADKIRVEFYGNIPVVMLSQFALQGDAWRVKRLIDVILSALAILTLSPALLLITAAIKISSPGPVFFKQTRIGLGGTPFDFFKFRSMHISNDESKHKQFVQDFIQKGKQGGDQNIQVFKITDDPRIFKFGKFIRKTSLDEFPQLFNVLKGDMSLVGPRPCLPYEWECYDEWHKNRLNILPGCTGLWQALGRSTVSFEEMVILDLYYISNMSLWLDLKIVIQTIPVIFFGKGGY